MCDDILLYRDEYKKRQAWPVVFWSWKWDLNPRPIDYESIALPLRHSSNYLDILSFFTAKNNFTFPSSDKLS